jgi:hypothetical protein
MNRYRPIGPTLLSRAMRATHSTHVTSWDLEGSSSPRGPQAIIDDLDPCVPSAMTPPPDLLHVAPISHLLDETGLCGGARHNSSTRLNGLDAINRLRKTSVDGMSPEAAPSTIKGAHSSLKGYTSFPDGASQPLD